GKHCPEKGVDIHHKIMIADGYSTSPPTTGQSRTFYSPQAWQESGLGAPTDFDELQRKITSLEQHNAELASALEEARSDLDAAREANRDLPRALQRG
ncbi:hypothetical protein ACFWSF_39505, partial [Streptomyces sp. NPDC058611]